VTIPTNLVVSNIATTSALLTWWTEVDASEIMIDGNIYYTYTPYSPVNNCYFLTNLTEGKQYTWKVRSREGSNYSDWVGGPNFTTTQTKIEEGININGVVWATRNVNTPCTFTEKPSDYGMFYQWNRPVGWCGGGGAHTYNSEGGGTWNNSISTGDTWEVKNNICPQGWRLPTRSEICSLDAADSFWSELNGVSGRFFGSDQDRLFLPAAGCLVFFPCQTEGHYGHLFNCVDGYSGYFWSSTSFDSERSYDLDFSRYHTQVVPCSREGARSARCVKE